VACPRVPSLPETATIKGWAKPPKAVLPSDLSPAAMLVFAALAAELFHRDAVEMIRAEIGACCGIGERQVRRSLRVFAEFGTRAHPQPPATDMSLAPPTATSESLAMPICGQCHLPRKRLHRSGICRGCTADLDLAAHVREVRVELGPDASPEQIAERMKQIAEEHWVAAPRSPRAAVLCGRGNGPGLVKNTWCPRRPSNRNGRFYRTCVSAREMETQMLTYLCKGAILPRRWDDRNRRRIAGD